MAIEICDRRCTCFDKHDLRFAQHSSCHGLKRFCNTWHWARRLFWFILVLASIAFMSMTLSQRITAYLQFRLKTEIALETYSKLSLPSVTICNMNMFSLALLTDMDYELLSLSGQIVSKIKTSYNLANLSSNPNATLAQYWYMANKFMEKETKILAKYNMNKSFSVRNWLSRVGWQLSKNRTIIQCTVGRQMCSANDFKPVFTPQGLCYTINGRDIAGRYYQRLPGIQAGFGILIDINQSDYTSYKLDSRAQYECGVKVLLHEPSDLVYAGTNLAHFVGIDPGRMSFISVHKYMQIRENNWPYDRCNVDNNSTLRNCIANCTANETISACNCRLWFESNVDDDDQFKPYCGVVQTTACLVLKEAMPNRNATMRNEIKFDENSCQRNCTPACNESSYTFGVSYTLLTSNSTSDDFMDLLHTVTGNEFRYTKFYIRKNVLSLQIAYPELEVDTIYWTPAFPFSAFVSDLGGQLGLFAGISVITIAELIEYPFLKLYNIFFTKKRKLRKHWRNSTRRGSDSDEIEKQQQNDADKLNERQLKWDHKNKNDPSPTMTAKANSDGSPSLLFSVAKSPFHFHREVAENGRFNENKAKNKLDLPRQLSNITKQLSLSSPSGSAAETLTSTTPNNRDHDGTRLAFLF